MQKYMLYFFQWKKSHGFLFIGEMNSLFINQEDRRRAPRILLRAKMRYQVRGSPAESDNVISNNISISGVAFNANKFLAPQVPLMLEIDILSKMFYPIGRVAWCQPLAHSSKNRLGIEFLEIDPLEKNFLEDYIKMQTGMF